MKYLFPHIALNVMNELASKKGDCASVILGVANDLGFDTKEHLIHNAEFSCHTESALASIADASTFDAIKSEVAKMEAEGRLLPCQVSPGGTVQSCFHKCPLLMDLFLQADKLRAESGL